MVARDCEMVAVVVPVLMMDVSAAVSSRFLYFILHPLTWPDNISYKTEAIF